MLKKLPLLAALVCWAGYSYSDSITPYYGITPNAAAQGHSWDMNNVLPRGVPGLDIDLVIYSYTPQKQTADDMVVHIQNENADGTDYIFRESDDWSGLAGGVEIRKVVPVTPVNRSNWGDGSIQVEGTGTVEDAFVFYNYRVDPCYDPQFDPNCPGYQAPSLPTQTEEPVINLENLYTDTLVELEIPEVATVTDTEIYDEVEEDSESEEEKKEKEEEEEKDSKERLEKALAAAESSAMFAEAVAQSQMLEAMNMAINMGQYYSATIDGGTYQESVTLVDKDIPDNKQGLRNGFAQQLLHEEMIRMQYNR